MLEAKAKPEEDETIVTAEERSRNNEVIMVESIIFVFLIDTNVFVPLFLHYHNLCHRIDLYLADCIYWTYQGHLYTNEISKKIKNEKLDIIYNNMFISDSFIYSDW